MPGVRVTSLRPVACRHGHALPGPLERGGLSFVQNPSNCLESKHSKCFTPMWRAATVTPYPAPSKEGAFPLYRILVTAWSLNIQSVLHRCGVPPRSRPTRPPRKRGPFLSHRILVTAWSPNIQSVLHRCGVPPRSRPTRPSALPVEGRWSVPGDKTSKMPRDNRACRHSHALPGPLERGGHTLCTEF